MEYSSSWNMHIHGPHIFFPIEEWRSDVANGDTFLGYQESVEHNIESLLHDINLEGVENYVGPHHPCPVGHRFENVQITPSQGPQTV